MSRIRIDALKDLLGIAWSFAHLKPHSGREYAASGHAAIWCYSARVSCTTPDQRALPSFLGFGSGSSAVIFIAAGLSSGSTSTPATPARRSLTGMRVTDLSHFMSLLGDQGKVATLQNNRMVTLNNEPAIVRSETLTLSVTPQIAPDGVVMLSLTPMLKAPAIAESDTLARVADGETLVISGFTRNREVRERTNLGLRGGWFGRGTVVTQKRVELLILLTPKIL